MRHVKWPSVSQAQPVRMLSVDHNQPVAVRFLGNYLGMLTHFSSKKTYPCFGKADCLPLIHRTRIIWKGYAPVDYWSLREECWYPAVLEITEGLEHQLSGRTLRGECWLLHKPGGEKFSPAQGIFSERLPEQELRAAFDVVPILSRFYHSNCLELGIPNPIPRPCLLPGMEGRRPKILETLAAPLPEEQAADPAVMEKLRERMRSMARGAKAETNGTK